MRTLLLALLLAACAAAPNVPAGRIASIQEVEEPAVASCRLLGRFEGVSAIPGESGMAQAREAARAKAAAAGATHVVAGREWQTPDAASAAVKAYACP